MKDSPINFLIAQALKEDVSHRDVTTNILIPKGQISHAYILVREPTVICGLDIVRKIFKKLDTRASFKTLCQDGDYVKANTRVIAMKAKTRALLTGERVALNFLSYLSGISTKTRTFVKETHPYKAHIMDTRKTTPGMRLLEKMAVRYGGGHNHRFDLNAMVIIKDNHRSAYQSRMSLKEMIAYAKNKTDRPVEIEVENIREIREALDANPDIIMLDNMRLHQIKKAVQLKRTHKNGPHILLEVSGNVNFHNVRQIAQTGVERISIGGLTHTRKAIDVSLEIIP